MPVSCFSDNEEPPPKCCKYCDESTDSGDGGGGPFSWRLTLDQDLIETLKSNFPSWFPSGAGGEINSAPISASCTLNTERRNSHISGETFLKGTTPSVDDLALLLSTSPSNSSSGASSTDSGVGTPSISFRSSSTSSNTSLPPSPPSIVIYATQIEQPPGQQAAYKQILLAEMAEGHSDLSSSGRQVCSEPPRLHIVDSFGFDAVNSRQTSPPKAVVDSSPLQLAMDKNKESLKVKLLVRRPINQLVEQGIIPPLKTSPAIHEQRKLLERAKTGDLLKAKIQQRPNRQELERRHILEHEESHVDPSLAERQRMLKKARLADQLNSQLSHRPGPLELIKKNILHVEEPIERIVKEGLVSFRATSEGLLNRPQHPQSYVTFEDDSQNSSESGCGVGPEHLASPQATDVLEVAATSAGIVTVALTIPTSGGAVVVTSGPILQSSTAPTDHSSKMPELLAVPPPPPLPLPIEPESEIKAEIVCTPPPPTIKSETPQRFAELCQSLVGTMCPSPTLVPIYPAGQKPFAFGSQTQCTRPSLTATGQSLLISRSGASPLPLGKFDAPGKDKYRKKSKCKPTTKARPIKFHEYKGPPNAAQKNSSVTQSQSEETSYQLLLKQQNFLLEYLEGLHKQPSGSVATPQQPPKPHILMMTETNFVQKASFATISNNTAAASLICNNQPILSPAPSVASTVSTVCTETNSGCASHQQVDLNRLEKMKVSDLKLQLKKRNLPVSGPKPQLIERLKPYLPLELVENQPPQQVKMEMLNGSEAVEPCDFDAINSPHVSLSPASEHDLMDVQHVEAPPQLSTVPVVVLPPLKEDVVREQQRKIDELQRRLKESQDELLQMKQNHTAASQIQSKEQPVNQKLIFKQQLEAKIQKEKMLQIENLQRQQKEYLANQQQVLKNVAAAAVVSRSSKSNKHLIGTVSQPVLPVTKPLAKDEAPALAFNENALQHLANKNKNLEIVWNGEQALFLVGVPQTDGNNNPRLVGATSTGHHRTSSMPSILVPIGSAAGAGMAHLQGQILIQQNATAQYREAKPTPMIALQDVTLGVTETAGENVDPPVLPAKSSESEAKQKKRVHRNSQMMTDVLEILIKNGDLPESAAQVPATPMTTPTITGGGSMMAITSGAPEFDATPLTMHTEPVTPPPQALDEDLVTEGCHRPIEVMGDLDLSSMLRNLTDPNRSVGLVKHKVLEEGDGSRLHDEETGCHMTKTLDQLLNGNAEESKRNDSLNGCSRLGSNDVVMNSSLGVKSNGSARSMTRESFLPGPSVEEMDHFDEIEFMALMKLDMDMAEDNSTFPVEVKLENLDMMQGQTQTSSRLYDSFVGELAMDESSSTLLPANAASGPMDRAVNHFGRVESSLSNELSLDRNGNASTGRVGDAHGYPEETPMDIEDFSNSLSAFDFPFEDATIPGIQPNQQIGNGGHGDMASTMVYAGTANRDSGTSAVEQAGVNSSPMSVNALQNTSSSSTSNNNHQGGVVFGSVNSQNDQLGMVDVPTSLLYDSHLPMGHDYSLELFDELRIPTDSMTWNELDFPIYGK